jgi:hypothetical protein
VVALTLRRATAPLGVTCRGTYHKEASAPLRFTCFDSLYFFLFIFCPSESVTMVLSGHTENTKQKPTKSTMKKNHDKIGRTRF